MEMTMEEFNISTPGALALLQHQLEAWPLAAANFKALQNVETREMHLHHTTFTLQYNPATRSDSVPASCAKQIARPNRWS